MILKSGIEEKNKANTNKGERKYAGSYLLWLIVCTLIFIHFSSTEVCHITTSVGRDLFFFFQNKNIYCDIFNHQNFEIKRLDISQIKWSFIFIPCLVFWPLVNRQAFILDIMLKVKLCLLKVLYFFSTGPFMFISLNLLVIIYVFCTLACHHFLFIFMICTY